MLECEQQNQLRAETMSSGRVYTKADLTGIRPAHTAFVGLDSDGCVFPTMEIKQKKCFHTLIVSQWHLEAVEKAVREAAEFINLYSKWRGTNRFAALVLNMELLQDHPQVKAAGVKVPLLPSLKRFVESGQPLGNPSLEAEVKRTGDPELAAVLQWSKDVNAMIERTVKNVAPFRWVLESLKKIQANADAICVSQTPTEALVREWEEHGLTGYVLAIAGQELGTKTEHIAMAASGRYAPDRILMIGDAPGDLKAARGNQGLFCPITPDREDACWERFFKEGLDRFLAGTFKGAYEAGLIREFEACLPDTPPWKH